MPADYSHALNEIIVALNRPTTPGWLIAIVGALTGVGGGLATQLFLRWYDGFSKRRDLRRAICSDLGQMFWAVHAIHSCPSCTRVWQEAQVKALLKFTVEEHANRSPDIYLQLREHGAAEMIYRQLHQLVEVPAQLAVNLSLVLSIFSSQIQEGYLPAGSLCRAVGRKR